MCREEARTTSAKMHELDYSAAGAGGSGGGAGATGAVSLSRTGSDAFLEAGGAGGADAGADSYRGRRLDTGAGDELDDSLLWEERRLLEDERPEVELLDSVSPESEFLELARRELERRELERRELESLELVSST